jgi:hypothetical protein
MGIVCTSKKSQKRLKKRYSCCVFEKKVVSLPIKCQIMNKWIVLIASLLVLSGCGKWEQVRKVGVAAEYNGVTLTYAELDGLTKGLSPEDSARVADAFVQQWAASLIVWERAKEQEDREVRRKVEEYRRALCQYEWEQRQVAQKMPTHIEDSLVMQFYESNKQHFVLEEAIVKGLQLVIPLGAPNIDKMRKAVKTPDDEECIEAVEKYAYQYATGYELFLEEWMPVSRVAFYMPVSTDELARLLRQKRQIELQDTVNTYLLQVVDVCSAGEYKPLEYVRKEIEEMILSQRRVDYLEKIRQDMYNKALEQRKIKRYEK